MKVLLTGAAGFIGSNILRSLVKDEKIEKIIAFDNLSTGYLKNINDLLEDNKIEFVEGDIRDAKKCSEIMEGVNIVCHQAALGSVPRSINDPSTSHDVNSTGFINILAAASQQKVKRVVYASSSSVYGDIEYSPKVETVIGSPISPYAVTKLTNELYASVFSRSYGMQIIGLRYFNVFGAYQNKDGAYAAVIPKFISAALSKKSPCIYGDGSVMRDFTPVKNVVQVNELAMFSDLSKESFHEVINVACGQSTSILDIWKMIAKITRVDLQPIFEDPRPGDINKSLANINKAKQLLSYSPDSDIYSALIEAIDYYKRS
jgi:UDP-N-acetylglucosamine 4-epimerase